MAKFSESGSMRNSSKNQEMLNFAKSKLNTEQFDRLYQSYRQLFWFQVLIPIIALIVIFVLCLVMSEYALLIACFGTIITLFLFILSLIISQFMVGRLWHRYVKWYRQPSSMDELYALFWQA